ncbi:OTU domain-containing protein-like protein isoform X1 [Tanacetum coccineum]
MLGGAGLDKAEIVRILAGQLITDAVMTDASSLSIVGLSRPHVDEILCMRATDLRFAKNTIARIENARERLTVGQLALRAPFGQNTVVNELIKRRSESEWFIEGDFKAYVSNMKRSHFGGVEPELLMLSHVLKYTIEKLFFNMLMDTILENCERSSCWVSIWAANMGHAQVE